MLLPAVVVGLALQVLAAAAAASPALPKVTITGKVIFPEAARRPAEVEVLISLDSGLRLSTSAGPDGRFALAEVPEGVHLVDVVALGFTFPSLTLDVGSSQSGVISAVMADVPGIPAANYPLIIGPVAKQDYYEVRQGFNVIGFIKTPYGLMIAFMVFSMYIMPKLKVDPEEYKDLVGGAEKDKPPQAITGRGRSSSGGSGSSRKDD